MSINETNLQQFLFNKYSNWNNIRVQNLEKMTAGWETDIYAFDLEFEKDGNKEQRHLICRLYPGPSGILKAKSEYEKILVMQAVNYPVPNILLHETDGKWLGKPFLIMQRINGPTMWQEMNEGDKETKNKMISRFSNLFVKLHDIDWRKVPQIPDEYHKKSPRDSFLERIDSFDAMVSQADIHYLKPLIDWLRENHGDVSFKRYSFLHGDFHPGNILIDQEEKAYVIDWTAARIGDYRSDLAWTLMLALMHIGGEWVDVIYNGYKTAAGHDISNLDYFMIEAAIRRFSDVLISLRDGPEARGMRKETFEAMRTTINALTKLHDQVEEITDMRIQEIDELMDEYS